MEKDDEGYVAQNKKYVAGSLLEVHNQFAILSQ